MTVLTGLEILIERMKTHPEEFDRDGKWVDILVNIDRHLTDEERNALKKGFSDAAREKFNELVLKGIAGEGLDWAEVSGLAQSYDSVMKYPMEKRKMFEEEQQQKQEAQLEYMKREMQKQMYAQQARGNPMLNAGMGLLGNQAKGIW